MLAQAKIKIFFQFQPTRIVELRYSRFFLKFGTPSFEVSLNFTITSLNIFMNEPYFFSTPSSSRKLGFVYQFVILAQRCLKPRLTSSSRVSQNHNSLELDFFEIFIGNWQATYPKKYKSGDTCQNPTQALSNHINSAKALIHDQIITSLTSVYI